MKIALQDKERTPKRFPGLLACVLFTAALVTNGLLLQKAVASSTSEEASEQFELQKVGEARLKFLFWSVYDSALYTPSGQYDDGVRPLKLEIQYLLDVKADALLERTLMEWSDMGREHPRQESWREELASMWIDIAAGDTLTLELDEENRSTFRHNGELLGHIEDPEFGQQFVDIWLSEDCTRPKIRQALLGLRAR